MVDCQGDLHIDVMTFDNFEAANLADPVQPSDPEDPESGLALNTDGFGFSPGAASSVVIVRAYYMYPIHTPVLGKFYANMPDNKRLVSWTVAFENEPF
ncbi:MAG: hypothetical protein ACR2OR_09525 [Hyphomicrobiales bacterium]